MLVSLRGRRFDPSNPSNPCWIFRGSKLTLWTDVGAPPANLLVFSHPSAFIHSLLWLVASHPQPPSHLSTSSTSAATRVPGVERVCNLKYIAAPPPRQPATPRRPQTTTQSLASTHHHRRAVSHGNLGILVSAYTPWSNPSVQATFDLPTVCRGHSAVYRCAGGSAFSYRREIVAVLLVSGRQSDPKRGGGRLPEFFVSNHGRERHRSLPPPHPPRKLSRRKHSPVKADALSEDFTSVVDHKNFLTLHVSAVGCCAGSKSQGKRNEPNPTKSAKDKRLRSRRLHNAVLRRLGPNRPREGTVKTR